MKQVFFTFAVISLFLFGSCKGNFKTVANYAGRRIMWITPNEAKRLGVKECPSPSGNSVGVQPTSGLRERFCILFTPNRFASLGVMQIKPFRFTVLDKLF